MFVVDSLLCLKIIRMKQLTKEINLTFIVVNV